MPRCRPCEVRIPRISDIRALGGLLAVAVFATGATSHGSVLARGASPRGPTHLRLIVPSAPPSILDVDAHTALRTSGITLGPHPTLWVAPVPLGAVAVVIGARSERAVLIRPDGSTRKLAVAASLVASWNSTAVWALDRRRSGGCVLRLVPGARSAIRAPCGNLDSDGEAGVVIRTAAGEVLVDPRTGGVRLHVRGDNSAIVPLHGGLVLEESATPNEPTKLLLLDLGTRRRRVLGWPSQTGGLDSVVAEPRGPLVAVGFADPTTNPQREDLLVLDTRTGRFTRVPGFPIEDDLKFSSVAWASDDRLVLTVHLGNGTRLGIYRPGHGVSLRPLRLPAFAGSDTFVPLVSR
jgi:hypothetical protein